MDYKTVTKCRVCGSKKLTKYLDLGEVPLANNFENKKEYPLEVLLCQECHLSMLSVVVNDFLFIISSTVILIGEWVLRKITFMLCQDHLR